MAAKEKNLKNKGGSVCESLALELWTPAHIGSGEELKNNLDFVLKNSQPFVADIKRLLDSIRTDDPRLNSYCKTAELEDLIKIAGREHGYSLPGLSGRGLSSSSEDKPRQPAKNPAPAGGRKNTSSGTVRMPVKKPRHGFVQSGRFGPNSRFSEGASEIQTIREQLKDAFLRPFIPGSSIKGAIRTALWAEALRQSEPLRKFLSDNLSFGNKAGRAFNPARNRKNRFKNRTEGRVFSSCPEPNPQKDLMRILHVSDGYFERGSLCLGDVRWANVCSGQDGPKIKWRDLKAKRENSLKNKSAWQDARGVYIEALAAGAKAEFAVSWDEFLLSDLYWSPINEKGKEPGGRQDKVRESIPGLPPRNFNELKTILNRHALRVAESEKGFFKKYGLPQLYEFYSGLEKKIEKTKNDFAWLRLGWGSGWTGMTGLTEGVLSRSEPSDRSRSEPSDRSESEASDSRAGGNQYSRKNSLKEKIYSINKARGRESYPKTRRLLTAGGSPRIPLGWARLSPSNGAVQNPYRKSGAASAAKNKRRPA